MTKFFRSFQNHFGHTEMTKFFRWFQNHFGLWPKKNSNRAG